MTIKTWLEIAIQDAERRGLPELKPLLEGLAKATSALRTAEWNADASGDNFESPLPIDSTRGKPTTESSNGR
jgi:hypothetical protein